MHSHFSTCVIQAYDLVQQVPYAMEYGLFMMHVRSNKNIIIIMVHTARTPCASLVYWPWGEESVLD